MVNENNGSILAKTLRVLVVEDDRVTARVAAAICESLGYAVHVVHDGMQAVSHLREHAADVVFMDLAMPKMGGYEAAHEIRCMEEEMQLTPVPIIAVSGAMKTDEYVRCMQVGMNESLSKPYTLRMVQDVIARNVKHAAFNNVQSDVAAGYAEGGVL